jgi:hypothetical protein
MENKTATARVREWIRNGPNDQQIYIDTPEKQRAYASLFAGIPQHDAGREITAHALPKIIEALRTITCRKPNKEDLVRVLTFAFVHALKKPDSTGYDHAAIRDHAAQAFEAAVDLGLIQNDGEGYRVPTRAATQPTKPDAPETNTEVSFDAKAVAYFTDNPRATMQQVADAIGCTREYVYDLEQFKKVKPIIKNAYQQRVHGGKDKTGSMDDLHIDDKDE